MRLSTASSPGAAIGSAGWADALLLSFAQAGYVRAEPAILQPAEPFLDLSGEDIRKSLYLTTDASGEELCLRPDLTIPVARDYLASRPCRPAGRLLAISDRCFATAAAFRASFCRPASNPSGARTAPRPTPKCSRSRSKPSRPSASPTSKSAPATWRCSTPLIEALDLYPVWRRRLIKDFNRKVSLEQDLERLTMASSATRNEYEGVLAALAGSDRNAALALVTDLMSIAGTTNVGGRTVARNRRSLPRAIDAEGRRLAARRARA